MPMRPSGANAGCEASHTAACSMASVMAGVIAKRERSGMSGVTTAIPLADELAGQPHRAAARRCPRGAVPTRAAPFAACRPPVRRRARARPARDRDLDLALADRLGVEVRQAPERALQIRGAHDERQALRVRPRDEPGARDRREHEHPRRRRAGASCGHVTLPLAGQLQDGS